MEEDIKKLEQLIYEDVDFKKLSELKRKKSKNIFEIIVKDKDELTFSRTLKYYLDPKEEHNQKDYFLKEFFHLLVQKGYFDTDLNRLKVDLFDLNKAQAYREYSIGDDGRIDILIDLPKEVLCMIEVKLFSNEGTGQTDRYFKWAEKNKRDYKYKLFCFLTPEGYAPEHDKFIPLGFSDIISIFKKDYIVELNENNIFLLNNFINWIEELSPVDDKTKKICRKIYTNNKSAIDLIMESLPTEISFFKDLAKYINSKYSKYKAKNGKYWLTLSPKSWLDKEGLVVTNQYTNFRLEYFINSKGLNLSIVTPTKNDIPSYIEGHFKDIFECDFDKEKSSKEQYQSFYVFYSEESFNAVDFFDSWDDTIEYYGKKIKNKFDELRKNEHIIEVRKRSEKTVSN